jgi:hypothetical protein
MAKTSAVDIFVVYQFIKRLATPFNKWEAYKTGVIDERGNIKTPKNKRDRVQNNSFKVFDVMILKLKRILEKIPFGKTRLASYASALYLVREDWEDKTEKEIMLESDDKIIDYLRLYNTVGGFDKMLEDAPTMNAGDGNIAGMGYNGPDDVKVTKNKKKYKDQNKIDAALINRKFGQLSR